MRTKQRYGTAADLDAIVAAQLAAFADEAVVRWVAAGATDPDGLGAGFVVHMVREALDRDEVLLAESDGRIVGVSIWQDMADASRASATAAEAAAGAAADPGLARVAAVSALIAERHPAKPHVYLASMGVVPDCRGQGVGGAMLRHRLAAADAAGRAAYLEASTPASRNLYGRHGFVQSEPDIALPDDGPRLHPMWRESAAV